MLRIEPEDAYQIVLKWLHDDYACSIVAKSIKLIDKDNVAKAVNAILQTGSILFKAVSDENGKVISERYNKLSAFILYHWDGTFTLRRSLIGALCNFYNTGFVLLRCSLDTLLQGSLYQCLSQKKYRKSEEVKKVRRGELKNLIDDLIRFFEKSPHESSKVNETSARIFDVMNTLHKQYKPKIIEVVKLLSGWGLFKPIEDPVGEFHAVYHSKLSFVVHQHYTTTDIGRAILEKAEIFEVSQPFLKETIEEYLKEFHKVLEFWLNAEQNLIKYILFNDPI
jgi:hypothetical protein